MATRQSHPLSPWLVSLARQHPARQVVSLREENRVMSDQVAEQTLTMPSERRRLVRTEKGIGAKLRDLISIVSYESFRRWVREMGSGEPVKGGENPRKSGRPRTPDDVRKLILIMRREKVGLAAVDTSQGPN